MDQQNAELEKRLEKLEQQFSDMHKTLDALVQQTSVQTVPKNEKKSKGKLFLLVCIPILLLCLLAGGFFAFRGKQKSEPPSYAKAEIGDIVTFGQYEQNNSVADGPEPIEWIVLDKQDGKILLLSRYVLYEASNYGPAWRASRLRDSLNDSFISSAFTRIEQEKICTTKNEDGKYLSTDMVFLLSREEAEKYFPALDSRKCSFAFSDFSEGSSTWWLRSFSAEKRIGNKLFFPEAYVYYDGEIKDSLVGSTFSTMPMGVRPALWLDITQ